MGGGYSKPLRHNLLPRADSDKVGGGGTEVSTVEIKRRSYVVRIVSYKAAVTGLIGAILPKRNDEWAVRRARYMTRETIAPLGDDLAGSMSPLTA